MIVVLLMLNILNTRENKSNETMREQKRLYKGKIQSQKRKCCKIGNKYDCIEDKYCQMWEFRMINMINMIKMINIIRMIKMIKQIQDQVDQDYQDAQDAQDEQDFKKISR